MIKLLVFDFDGTLVDTAPGIHAAVNDLLADHGVGPLSLNEVKSYIGGGLEPLARRLFPHLEQTEATISSLIDQFRNHYLKYYLSQSRIYEGVVEFLKSWPHHLAIVSNKSEFFLKSTIESSELSQFSWVRIIGGDSRAHKKPHPIGIQECLKATGLGPNEALMIGDGEPDVGAALAAGVECVAVNYGYCSGKRLGELGAHHQIDHISDLKRLLER